jgi:N utilization substance protein B
MIGEALSGGWTLERLEPLIRTILEAGTYELLARPDIPIRVVITEYVEVAHAFFAGKEPALVNGVLDRLARTLRHDELETSPGERTTETR